MWGLKKLTIDQIKNSETVDWLHAVSYGETKVCLNFIRKGLEAEQLNKPILFTSTIQDSINYFEKGMRELRVIYPDVRWNCFFMILDFKPSISRFIGLKKIRYFFLFETDFWPATIFYLKSKGVKIYLINGRISYKLANFYSKFPHYSTQLFNSFSHLFVQSDTDASRLSDLGVSSSRISHVGNAKFDFLGNFEDSWKGSTSNSETLKIILLGSWHNNEVNVIDHIHAALPPGYQIWIAPRVPDNLDQFVSKINQLKASYSKYSELNSKSTSIRFVIVDSMGLLSKLYQYCELAVIGGSFNKVGGHNFVEPLIFKKPVIVGPYMRNFQDDIQEFLKAGLINQAKDQLHLKQIIKHHVTNPKILQLQAQKAFRHLETKMGSLEFTWNQIIRENLKSS